MTEAALIRAVGDLIFIVIEFHTLFVQLALPLAGTVVTALEVCKLTRNSGVLRQKEVEDIVYWNDPKKTGIAIGLFSIALHIVCKYSIMTVISHTLLFLFGAAATYRVLKKKAVNSRRTNTVYTFCETIVKYLLLLQNMPPSLVNSFVQNTICIYNSLLKLILAENKWESVKFSLILLSLTHIVRWIAEFRFTMTVICFGASTIPKIYKANQNTIDRHLATCAGCIKILQNLIVKKRPSLHRVPVADEEKKDE